jgi:hypothetical protein
MVDHHWDGYNGDSGAQRLVRDALQRDYTIQRTLAIAAEEKDQQ